VHAPARALQRDALKAAGCEPVFTDQGVSRRAADWFGLARALKALKPGDTLIV
jgi:DNA invertase Pin-like site-specific DNA recombinase